MRGLMKHIKINALFLFLTLSISVFASLAAETKIAVDQFGYRPDAKKTAVLKNPKIGFDSLDTYTPGPELQVILSSSDEVVFSGAPVLFNEGTIDTASGDVIWWFDFSEIKSEGRYYIYDPENDMKSYEFEIKESVYNDVLKAALRVLFYQRAGFVKEAAFAGEKWADNASHLQDTSANSFFYKTDPSTAKDVHGGWYDAGDFNKYTTWTSNYVETLLLAYLDNPEAFTDDYDIPESGNDIPDIIDEVKWGLDFLLRMQNQDGSLLSIVSLKEASPPSSTTFPSFYGDANTSATLGGVKAFALGARVFRYLKLDDYADTLVLAALRAFEWAETYPDSIFHNNSSSNQSTNLGAGDQEIDNEVNRIAYRLNAALHMYELTGNKDYLLIFENNWKDLPLHKWSNFVSQYWHADQMMFFRYLKMDGASKSIQEEISTKLKTGFLKEDDFVGAFDSDGYRSFIKDYNWGSNSYKAIYGLSFAKLAEHNLDPANNDIYKEKAEEYLHYIHGVNPFTQVYLTNMSSFGATKSITTIYHSWFKDGSSEWDYVSDSTSGPAPGFLAGGPNSDYTWDECCDTESCGGEANNAKCYLESLPIQEPASKMYKDINTSWPINSWEITEPSMGYQTNYIRLLSLFVEKKGKPLSLAPEKVKQSLPLQWNAFFRASELGIQINENIQEILLLDAKQRILLQKQVYGKEVYTHVDHLAPGMYFVKVKTISGKSYVKPVLKIKP